MYIGMLVVIESYEHIGKEWNRYQKRINLFKNKIMWSQGREWNKSSQNICMNICFYNSEYRKCFKSDNSRKHQHSISIVTYFWRFLNEDMGTEHLISSETIWLLCNWYWQKINSILFKYWIFCWIIIIKRWLIVRIQINENLLFGKRNWVKNNKND